MNHKKELPRGPTTWVPWVLGSFGVSVFEGLKFGGLSGLLGPSRCWLHFCYNENPIRINKNIIFNLAPNKKQLRSH